MHSSQPDETALRNPQTRAYRFSTDSLWYIIFDDHVMPTTLTSPQKLVSMQELARIASTGEEL